MPLVELTAVIPDRPFDPDVFEREIRKVLEDTNREIYRLYSLVWRTWDGEKPTMAQDVVVDGSDIYGEVYTDSDSHGNQKLMWIDDGTAPHQIKPKRSRFLRYRAKFRAKTRPNVVGSRPGGKYGSDWVYRRRVQHPGYPPRNISKTIARVRRRRFEVAISQAFDRAARNF